MIFHPCRYGDASLNLFTNIIKWKTINTTLSEQFHNPIDTILETGGKSIPLTHIYMTAHFPVLVRAIQTFLQILPSSSSRTGLSVTKYLKWQWIFPFYIDFFFSVADQTFTRIDNMNNTAVVLIRIRNRGQIGTPNTHIHVHSLSWLGTGISRNTLWKKRTRRFRKILNKTTMTLLKVWIQTAWASVSHELWNITSIRGIGWYFAIKVEQIYNDKIEVVSCLNVW